MVNLKKILAFVTVICLFLTPMTLRAETNIGVNPEQVAPPPGRTKCFSQFATTIDAKTGDVLYDKTHIIVHFRLV